MKPACLIVVHSLPWDKRVDRVALSVTMLALAASISGCATLRGTAPSPTPAQILASSVMAETINPASVDVERLASAIFHETNRVRVAFGLYQFKPLPKLNEAAALQAGYSALNLTSAHTQAIPQLALPVDRVRYVGLSPSSVAENAAMLPLWHLASGQSVAIETRSGGKTYIDPGTGQPPVWHSYASFAAAVVQGWLDSPGHRVNLLNREAEFLGCGARAGKSVNGFDVVAAVQVFYRPSATIAR